MVDIILAQKSNHLTVLCVMDNIYNNVYTLRQK